MLKKLNENISLGFLVMKKHELKITLALFIAGLGYLKKFSPAAGILNDAFCWRVSSEPPNFSKKDSVVLSKI